MDVGIKTILRQWLRDESNQGERLWFDRMTRCCADLLAEAMSEKGIDCQTTDNRIVGALWCTHFDEPYLMAQIYLALRSEDNDVRLLLQAKLERRSSLFAEGLSWWVRYATPQQLQWLFDQLATTELCYDAALKDAALTAIQLHRPAHASVLQCAASSVGTDLCDLNLLNHAVESKQFALIPSVVKHAHDLSEGKLVSHRVYLSIVSVPEIDQAWLKQSLQTCYRHVLRQQMKRLQLGKLSQLIHALDEGGHIDAIIALCERLQSRYCRAIFKGAPDAFLDLMRLMVTVSLKHGSKAMMQALLRMGSRFAKTDPHWKTTLMLELFQGHYGQSKHVSMMISSLHQSLGHSEQISIQETLLSHRSDWHQQLYVMQGAVLAAVLQPISIRVLAEQHAGLFEQLCVGLVYYEQQHYIDKLELVVGYGFELPSNCVAQWGWLFLRDDLIDFAPMVVSALSKQGEVWMEKLIDYADPVRLQQYAERLSRPSMRQLILSINSKPQISEMLFHFFHCGLLEPQVFLIEYVELVAQHRACLNEAFLHQCFLRMIYDRLEPVERIAQMHHLVQSGTVLEALVTHHASNVELAVLRSSDLCQHLTRIIEYKQRFADTALASAMQQYYRQLGAVLTNARMNLEEKRSIFDRACGNCERLSRLISADTTELKFFSLPFSQEVTALLRDDSRGLEVLLSVIESTRDRYRVFEQRLGSMLMQLKTLPASMQQLQTLVLRKSSGMLTTYGSDAECVQAYLNGFVDLMHWLSRLQTICDAHHNAGPTIKRLEALIYDAFMNYLNQDEPMRQLAEFATVLQCFTEELSQRRQRQGLLHRRSLFEAKLLAYQGEVLRAVSSSVARSEKPHLS